VVECLLKNRAIPNLQDSHKETALLYAADKATIKICKVLVLNSALYCLRKHTGHFLTSAEQWIQYKSARTVQQSSFAIWCWKEENEYRVMMSFALYKVEYSLKIPTYYANQFLLYALLTVSLPMVTVDLV